MQANLYDNEENNKQNKFKKIFSRADDTHSFDHESIGEMKNSNGNLERKNFKISKYMTDQQKKMESNNNNNNIVQTKQIQVQPKSAQKKRGISTKTLINFHRKLVSKNAGQPLINSPSYCPQLVASQRAHNRSLSLYHNFTYRSSTSQQVKDQQQQPNSQSPLLTFFVKQQIPQMISSWQNLDQSNLINASQRSIKKSKQSFGKQPTKPQQYFLQLPCHEHAQQEKNDICQFRRKSCECQLCGEINAKQKQFIHVQNYRLIQQMIQQQQQLNKSGQLQIENNGNKRYATNGELSPNKQGGSKMSSSRHIQLKLQKISNQQSVNTSYQKSFDKENSQQIDCQPIVLRPAHKRDNSNFNPIQSLRNYYSNQNTEYKRLFTEPTTSSKMVPNSSLINLLGKQRQLNKIVNQFVNNFEIKSPQKKTLNNSNLKLVKLESLDQFEKKYLKSKNKAILTSNHSQTLRVLKEQNFQEVYMRKNKQNIKNNFYLKKPSTNQSPKIQVSHNSYRMSKSNPFNDIQPINKDITESQLEYYTTPKKNARLKYTPQSNKVAFSFI